MTALSMRREALARHHPVRQAAVLLDGTLDVAVASLAWWTVLYAMVLLDLPLGIGAAAWLAGTAVLVALRIRSDWFDSGHAPTALQSGGATVVALAMALLSSVVSRPEWDDAAFVIRSTWVADHGAPATRDMIFSDSGGWPATFGQDPNISSIETLFGAIAHFSGIQAGSVVYRYFVPAATFAAVWVVWRMLRVWGARRPLASLALAMLVVIMGGYTHAPFGNFHLARIWQGKAVLVAVLVPYLYAVLGAATNTWRRDRGSGHRWAVPMTVFAAGVAGVGASSTAVFLVPLVVLVGVLPLIVHRRVLDATLLLAAGAAGPVLAGLVTVLSPGGAGNESGRATTWLWARVIADGWVGAVVVGAAVLVLLGLVRPRWFGMVRPDAQQGVALVVLCGLLFSLPPLYPVLTALMGGDAIAYRLAWVVPVPALVGLLASLPAVRWWSPVAPLVAGAVAIVMVMGQPLWSAANMAHIGSFGTWKVRDQADLAAARWIVDQQPEGRYLAANWVAFLVGTITSELRPVGTRLDYVRSLDGIDGALVDERVLLQRIADSPGEARAPENLPAAHAALDALDVDVACVAWNDDFTENLMSGDGFVAGFATGPWTCWSRTAD